MTNRSSQHSFIGPSTAMAKDQCRSSNIELARPFGSAHCAVVESKDNVSTSVSCLLATRRPSHVAWLIVAVIIDAVNCMIQRRPQTHVGKEGHEVIAPFFNHRNTATAVTMKAFIGRQIASLLDRAPDCVLGRFPHAVLSAQAATRSRLLVSQSRAADAEHGVATITNAVPNKSAKAVLTGKGEDGEALESLTIFNVHDSILSDSAHTGAVTCRGVLAHDAAARFLHVVIELAGRGLGEIAARTLALPEGLAPLVLADAPKHGKSVKLLSNCDSLAGGRHVLISIKNVLAWPEGLVPFGPLYFTTE